MNDIKTYMQDQVLSYIGLIFQITCFTENGVELSYIIGWWLFFYIMCLFSKTRGLELYKINIIIAFGFVWGAAIASGMHF